MGRINRYDQATPARDNYFNTFVPLPLDQLTALGMSRKQDLEKNQVLLEKAYDDALDINYIKESPLEEANYRNITKGVTDLAMKYRSADLTNPLEMANLRRELRSVADPTLIKRMEQSEAAYQQARALKMDMMAKGTWNDLLNEDPASKHNSAVGTYNWLPEAYQGRKAFLGQYFDNLPVDFKGIEEKDGIPFMIHGVRKENIDNILKERGAELIATPQGQQEIRLYKKLYPNSAEGKSDIEIMNIVARDYASKELHDQANPLPSEYIKAFGSKRGSSELPDYNELPVDTMPSSNVNPDVKRSSQLYRKDVERSKSIDGQIKEISTQLQSTKNPAAIIRLKAMQNDLVNQKKQIDSVIEQSKQLYMPDYNEKKDAIIAEYMAEMKAKGIDPNKARAALDDASTEWGEEFVNPAQEQLAQVVGEGLEGKWPLNKLGKMITQKSIVNPITREYLRYRGVKKYTQPVVSAAQGAYEKIWKLDNQLDRNIKDDYANLSIKAQTDNGILLAGSGLPNTSNTQMTTRDGKVKNSATSVLLKHLKDSGAQNIPIEDVSYVSKSRQLMDKTKDMNQFILDADNIGIDMVSPSTKPDGTYSMIITATKKVGENKPDVTKKFKLKLNDLENGLTTGSWRNSLALDLYDLGKYAEADRVKNPDLEMEALAQQNEDEIVVNASGVKGDELRFLNNGDGTYTHVDSYTGKPNPKFSDIDLNTVIQLIYSYRNKDSYESQSAW